MRRRDRVDTDGVPSTTGDDEGRRQPSSSEWVNWATRSLWYASATRPGGPGADGRFDPASTLRASDHDRTEVVDALSAHYAAGRLDKEELDARVRRALDARTEGELAPLLADLPSLTPVPHGPRISAWQRFQGDRAIACAVIAALVVLLALHHLLFWAVVAGVVLLMEVRRYGRARARIAYHDHLHEAGIAHWHSWRGPFALEQPGGEGRRRRERRSR